MTVDASQVIAPELEAGESLLWSGRPRTGIVFRGYDFFMIPFSILWGGFAFFAFIGTMRELFGHSLAAGVPVIAVPITGFMALVGIYVIAGRFLVEARQREHTFYAVSNRRVIILSGLVDRPLKFDVPTAITFAIGMGRRKVKSLDLRTLTDVSMTERSDGSGVITFGPQLNPLLANAGAWMNNSAASNFEQIENVKSVYEVIRAAQRKA